MTLKGKRFKRKDFIFIVHLHHKSIKSKHIFKQLNKRLPNLPSIQIKFLRDANSNKAEEQFRVCGENTDFVAQPNKTVFKKSIDQIEQTEVMLFRCYVHHDLFTKSRINREIKATPELHS